ncbi:DNA polymerase I [Desulfoprunum benzoelyticum]|uniref:DNA polymerase I n=1 Tax=Desulfoprunum benzoelyticum TaxID=1506996 RepID=A0A840UTG2_9BACT|nr:DNA polymerase-1 [Desulfoprunum benzoelyticum]MBM9530784.1 DNA polymerase I [Desulfoprunum benzoelyticum]
MQEEIYLIDGSAYIYRAYHALSPLSNSRGLATHAVYGFISILRRLFKERTPSYVAVAFDSRGPVFRHEIYRDYKANRPPMPADLAEQIPYIRKYVAAANLPILEQVGVEADDLIASAVRCLQREGHRVVIVSGDKDLLQLVNDRVTMWDPMKDKVMDSDEVKKKYNVTPAQLLDCFALIGDSADNIPGVPGIGPKTAEKLINQFGTLEKIYEDIGLLKQPKLRDKLVEGRESAFLARDLIRLKSDVAVPERLSAYAFAAPDGDQIRDLYSELEFTSLLKEIQSFSAVPRQGFICVRDDSDLKKMVKALMAATILCVDTETTSLDARTAQLVGISLCCEIDRSWYIPIGHRDADGRRCSRQLKPETVVQALRPFLESSTLPKLGHNLKYDYTVLLQSGGLTLKGPLYDSLIAAYLLEETGRSFKLDDLMSERGIRMTSFEQVTGGDKRPDCFAYVDIQAACDYSCEDVYAALVLWRQYEPLLQEMGMGRLFYEVEMPLVPILAQMEIIGIAINPDALARLSAEFSAKLAVLEGEIHAIAGREFNINSPRQLGQILFDELHLPYGRKTKTGYSTDVKVLEKLAVRHDLPARILDYRTLAKLQSTYVERLAQLQDPVTGRVHTSFNQAVTATGRLSSSNPNLQNIPIRSEDGNRIRQAFVPAEGMVFLAADYSQIDLRVLAHYSQDKALIGAFRAGEDIHARTAAEIFGVSPLLITPEMRRVAKSINFGIVYGMSSFGLSEQLNIGRKEAQTFIDRYFRLYEGVKRFMGDVVAQARRDGYVTTLLGRRRNLPDIGSSNRVTREFAERTAINTPIQGTAADIIKLAMVAVDQVIRKDGLPARLLLQVHDELVFELPPADLDACSGPIKAAMEQALQMDVPLVVNCTVGPNLAK